MISQFCWLMGSKGSNIMKMFHSTESSPGKESQYEESFQEYINTEKKKNPNKIKECGDNHQIVNKNFFSFYEFNSNMKDRLLQHKYFRSVSQAQTVHSPKWTKISINKKFSKVKITQRDMLQQKPDFFFLNLDGLSKPTSKKPPTKAPKLTLTSEQRYWSFNSTSRFANLNCSQGDLSFPFLFSLLTCRYVRKTQISIPAKKMLQRGLPITLIRH